MDEQRLREIRAMLEAATPGPWQAEDADSRLVVAGADRVIANVTAWDLNGPFDDAKANRDLIASAPTIIRELLEFAERETEPELIGVIRRYMSDPNFRQQVDDMQSKRPGQ